MMLKTKLKPVLLAMLAGGNNRQEQNIEYLRH
jgi:hypothetical protein